MASLLCATALCHPAVTDWLLFPGYIARVGRTAHKSWQLLRQRVQRSGGLDG